MASGETPSVRSDMTRTRTRARTSIRWRYAVTVTVSFPTKRRCQVLANDAAGMTAATPGIADGPPHAFAVHAENLAVSRRPASAPWRRALQVSPRHIWPPFG